MNGALNGIVEPKSKHPAIPYVAPFLAFIAFLAIEKLVPGSPEVLYSLRFIVVSAVLLAVSSKVIPFRPSYLLGSIAMGVAVFLIWIGPDLLWPGYRSHWLFTNLVTGKAESSLPASAQSNLVFILIRVAGATLLVPILEELFWRGWLMRWLISKNFLTVPLGRYSTEAFWLTAVLFASEHGPYWEVGLAAGILYNWWIMRTGNLADCILAHSVTNACLCAYVLQMGHWQYWL